MMLDSRQLGVQHGISKPPAAKGKAARSRHQGVRVVYIASPMKLTASPEEFRAVVQELTGRHSNISHRQYVDSIHPPPPPARTANSVAPPPPPSVSAAALRMPLPRQIFQSSYDGGGEYERAQAAGLCYGPYGQEGYYW